MVINAYAERKQAAVMESTWGHLAPEPGRYAGSMLFAHSAYGGESLLVDADWQGLDDSPWLLEDMQAYWDGASTQEGRIYRWRGTYVRFKNGKCRFTGSMQLVR